VAALCLGPLPVSELLFGPGSYYPSISLTVPLTPDTYNTDDQSVDIDNKYLEEQSYEQQDTWAMLCEFPENTANV
ncbi:hypothetical protein ACLOJK_018855, partial [Asimina triloba]